MKEVRIIAQCEWRAEGGSAGAPPSRFCAVEARRDIISIIFTFRNIIDIVNASLEGHVWSCMNSRYHTFARYFM